MLKSLIILIIIAMNIKLLTDNLKTISNNSLENPSYFRTENGAIKTNTFLRKFCLQRQSVTDLRKVLKDNIQYLNKSNSSIFYKNASEYSELFIAAQKYNQTVSTSQKFQKGIFSDLNFFSLINKPKIKGLKSVEAISTSTTRKKKILKKDFEYVQKTGFFKKEKTYYYDRAKSFHFHFVESLSIFLFTQTERVLSFVGRIFETFFQIFGIEINYFKKFHYFSKNLKNEEIYKNDMPLSLSNDQTSYWLGHASCFFRIKAKSTSNKNVFINILTDPVEGNLNKIFYPRMTKPARLLENLPPVHILLLSHNHLDHYSSYSLKKLLPQQPVMIVPKGDEKRIQQLGFKKVYPLNWWNQAKISFKQNDQTIPVKITAVPANHWSGQGFSSKHKSTFLGYVIHGDKNNGDTYFAGDTARLSEDHMKILRKRFNIKTMFQPAGPDERRKDMQTTHQASVDGFWMHVNLLLKNLYQSEYFLCKRSFIEKAKKLKTIFMHTKTYKLGNLHFDDTDKSIKIVLNALNSDKNTLSKILKKIKPYEKNVYFELLKMAKSFKFLESEFNSKDLFEIFSNGIVLPRIGERTSFYQNSNYNLIKFFLSKIFNPLFSASNY